VANLFTLTDRLLERALDGVAARQRVTAHNIANVNTPGYKRHRLSFEESLHQAVEKAERRRLERRDHPSSAHPHRRAELPLERPFRVERDMTTTMRNDGNNVDIEAELAQLTKDQVFYQALADQVARRYAMLRAVITEGRR